MKRQIKQALAAKQAQRHAVPLEPGKAYRYLRLSTDEQRKGDGADRQRRSCQRCADAIGYKIMDEFADLGVSGSIDTMDRPAWQKMIAKILGNGVRCIIVEQLDRLSRMLMVQESAVAMLAQHGIELRSSLNPYVNLASNDIGITFQRQIEGAVAQQVKSNLVARMKDARNARSALLGRRIEGRRAYGTTAAEAAVVDRIFSLRNAGWSLDAIAKALNDDQIPPSTPGRRWRGSSVNNIIHTRRQATPGAKENH
jgi:DNA invertase Pin-like site-specific DNA recombinase